MLDALNYFKAMGALAKVLDGKEWLAVLHGVLHPDGDPFSFAWEWLAPSGLSVKDFIAPSSFRFGEARRFQMGSKVGTVSFLQITAPELNDRVLADLLDTDSSIFVSVHIRSMDQNEAIKTVKRKITDLDSMSGRRGKGSIWTSSPPTLPPMQVKQRTSSVICKTGMSECS